MQLDIIDYLLRQVEWTACILFPANKPYLPLLPTIAFYFQLSVLLLHIYRS